jgi:iron-sulfur cluster assembly protein
MITITNKAAEKIKELLKANNKYSGLRVGVSTTGCSGYAYQLEWNNQSDQDDVIIRDNDIEITINKKWSNVFFGSTLDYKKEGLNEGFEFVNPNEKARCGCGESFTV